MHFLNLSTYIVHLLWSSVWTHVHYWTRSSLAQVYCYLWGAKPSHEPMVTHCLLDPSEQTSVKCVSKFSFKKMPLKMSSAKCRPFCHGLRVISYWLDPLIVSRWGFFYRFHWFSEFWLIHSRVNDIHLTQCGIVTLRLWRDMHYMVTFYGVTHFDGNRLRW